MLKKSIGYDISTTASPARRPHLRTALLAVLVGLAVAAAAFASAHASPPPLQQSGDNATAGKTTAKTGAAAARLAADAVGRAARNPGGSAVRHDLWGNPVYPGVDFHASGTGARTDPAGSGGR